MGSSFFLFFFADDFNVFIVSILINYTTQSKLTCALESG